MSKIVNSTALWAVMISLNTVFIVNNIIIEDHFYAAINFVAGIASWLCYFRAAENNNQEDNDGS